MGGGSGRAGVQLLEKSAIEQFPVPEAVQVLVPAPFALPKPISPPTHVIQLDSWPRPWPPRVAAVDVATFLPISQWPSGICAAVF